MTHVTPVSRRPALALNLGGGSGNITIAEQAVLLLLSLFFSDWQNYAQVIQNLQKYYRKTPD